MIHPSNNQTGLITTESKRALTLSHRVKLVSGDDQAQNSDVVTDQSSTSTGDNNVVFQSSSGDTIQSQSAGN